RSNQPMTRFQYTIAFNGEIYNYRELRTQFEQQGYPFKTQSDTEVILAAYQYYGTQCTNLFNGMWAFAIYDQHREEIFLSVDRFGIKPLYYLVQENTFYFASEIKQFQAIPSLTFIPNKT